MFFACSIPDSSCTFHSVLFHIEKLSLENMLYEPMYGSRVASPVSIDALKVLSSRLRVVDSLKSCVPVGFTDLHTQNSIKRYRL